MAPLDESTRPEHRPTRRRASYGAAPTSRLDSRFARRLCLPAKTRATIAADGEYGGLVVSVAVAAVAGARASRAFVDPRAPPAAARARPPPRRAAARLAGHVAAAALFYAAALSGGSPAARGVRRPLVLGARCALARDAAACASRRRYLGKVAARNRLHKARRALGLARGATLDDAKRARKRVALEFHPDKNPSPDARDVFGRAEAAYELLAADFKRERAAKGGDL